mgnify:CR=1 FL=1
MERLIFHIDVNSAFLSWESARRVKQGLQDLRDIPACIGGDPKSVLASYAPVMESFLLMKFSGYDRNFTDLSRSDSDSS